MLDCDPGTEEPNHYIEPYTDVSKPLHLLNHLTNCKLFIQIHVNMYMYQLYPHRDSKWRVLLLYGI